MIESWTTRQRLFWQRHRYLLIASVAVLAAVIVFLMLWTPGAYKIVYAGF